MPYSLEDARYFEKTHDYLKAADIYQELGELEKAKALYLAQERQYPFHKQIKFKLGKLLTLLQEWDEAIVKLQEVENVGVFLEETLYLLAECFRNKGYIHAAKEMYVELLERNYHYKDAKEKLQALDAPGLSQLTIVPRFFPPPSSESNGKTSYQTMQGIPVEDRYVLIEELGRGGMGIVYKAEEKPSGRLVAIKVLPPYLAEEEVNRVRFFREASIVAKLHHPHIVKIFETNQQGNFIVMEYLAGGALSTWRKQHNLTEQELLTFIGQILDALHTVHQQGIIHRDLKPENILIADRHTAKLTDFGIAHICGATITHTGTHLGTIPYMSPEQILGKDIDKRSDIYSIGVMLYELLTGELPFTGKDTSYHHIHTLPRPPCELAPTLSPELNAMILKCLAKRPEDRYQDGASLRVALLAYLTRTG
jgi:tetratricopeptide (TPR) repeat protein